MDKAEAYRRLEERLRQHDQARSKERAATETTAVEIVRPRIVGTISRFASPIRFIPTKQCGDASARRVREHNATSKHKLVRKRKPVTDKPWVSGDEQFSAVEGVRRACGHGRWARWRI